MESLQQLFHTTMRTKLISVRASQLVEQEQDEPLAVAVRCGRPQRE